MQNRDLALQDRLKTPPDVKTLGLAADEHGYRLKIERHLACCLNCRDACGFCRDRGVTHRRDGVELRLQLGSRGGPLRLQFGDPGDRVCLGLFGLRL